MSKQIRYLDPDKDKVNCNLCGKYMYFNDYERHYDKCLSTKYLMNRIFQEKGVKPEYDEIFYLKENTFNELYKKYDKKVI